MSLFSQGFNPIASASFNGDPVSAVVHPASSTVILTTESGTSPALRMFNLVGTSLSPITKWTFSTSIHLGVVTTIASGACAVIAGNNSDSHIYVLSLSNGASSQLSITNNVFSPNTSTYSQATFDPLKFVYFTGNSSNTNKIMLFRWDTWTASYVAIDGLAGSHTITCTQAMPNGNMLCGTNQGTVIEVDPATCRSLGSMNLPVYENVLTNLDFNKTINLQVKGFICNGDYIHVWTLYGVYYILHWPSKTVIYRAPAVGSVTSAVLCASGVLYYATQNAAGGLAVLQATDVTRHPPKMIDVFYFIGPTNWYESLLVGSNLIFLTSTDGNSHLGVVMTLTSSSIPNTVPVTSNLVDNTAQAGRIIRVIDGGVGSSYIYSDSPTTINGVTELIATGQTILELGVYGSGVNEKAAFSTYQT